VQIDGTASLYASLLKQLDTVESEALRSQRFMDYMDVFFCLNQLEKAGLDPENARHRGKADYLRVARGWSFDPDGREAAVLKGWVQSRFGLLPRYHGEPIDSPDSEAYLRFQEMRSMGIYNTNALDSQLDLLYTFCQYELSRRFPEKTHLRLFRGVNRWDQYETLYECSKRERILLLNNLNSFSDSRERAEEFGDVVFQAEIPIQKICFFHQLLPRMLKGEGEFVVLGGVARVKRVL
jgi:NAD+--dinitrogen-reductase ADP-D-ribosyltransferase